MEQLFNICKAAARNRFKGQPIRIWTAKLGKASWRAFVVNTENKLTLATGPLRKTQRGALTSLTSKLASRERKAINDNE